MKLTWWNQHMEAAQLVVLVSWSADHWTHKHESDEHQRLHFTSLPRIPVEVSVRSALCVCACVYVCVCGAAQTDVIHFLFIHLFNDINSEDDDNCITSIKLHPTALKTNNSHYLHKHITYHSDCLHFRIFLLLINQKSHSLYLIRSLTTWQLMLFC